MKWLNRVIFILHMFVGIGALFGGMAAILSPLNPIGISTDFLKNSPFQDFLIPGILLFTVIGLGNIFSGISQSFKSPYQGYISSIFSWALVIWIVVQCIMLQAIGFLHVLYFIIGLVQAFFAALLLLRQRLFPAKIVLGILSALGRRYPKNSLLIALTKLTT